MDGSKQKVSAGDECIIGLDVGSTTTKSVLLRLSDNAVVASVYLRTNGDPAGASRKCYAELAEQIGSTPINILGLGTTGSGRLIAGIHAQTKLVINEIISHATAARFIDPAVDTVFEIGGQDAKYTYLVNAVATDYAMNEACSAGTGSFIEESTGEHLKINFYDIAGMALKATQPLNFSDECSAFIAGDINKAVQDGFGREDIVAGIIYSICMNYLNRVKQTRPVGKKILMQGGVCYNKAVPLAMAGLTGKHIIVPPEPGLMGALGVALEVKKRMELGLVEPETFSLDTLATREINSKEPFICKGGKEKCDRGCEISRLVVEGKIYPFGGICRKYENLFMNRHFEAKLFDHVAQRTALLYESENKLLNDIDSKRLKIGINKSFFTNTFFPLYNTFFQSIGCEVITPDLVEEETDIKPGSAFCYPLEASHATFSNLVQKKPDYYFMPLVHKLENRGNGEHAKTCVFVQAETSCLKAAFTKHIDKSRILSPLLDFSEGWSGVESTFVSLAKSLGVRAKKARSVFQIAVSKQEHFYQENKKIGNEVLLQLEKDPSSFAVVLFGRPYNALNDWLNMGIPHKVATQGIHIIPYDAIPFHNQPKNTGMYWGIGHDLLQCTQYVKNHPQLFGIFVTNFSCGPDSFLLGYFRDLMGNKPSLTLELDSHTADVGIITRIEAFLDIVRGYREQHLEQFDTQSSQDFTPAYIQYRNERTEVVTSSNESISLKDPRIHVLIPEMGQFRSNGLASVLRRYGVRASMLPADGPALKKGRMCGTCKECLPFQLTSGSLLEYLDTREPDDEVALFFMSQSHGPCRQGQYTVALKQFIAKNRIPDVAVFSLDDETGFTELGSDFATTLWHVVVISDLFDNIRNALLALAINKEEALKTLSESYDRILQSIETESLSEVRKCLVNCAQRLGNIPLNMPIENAPKIRLLGEVFVRGNSFCREELIDKLSQGGFVVQVVPLAEYIYYCDYSRKLGYTATVHSPKRNWKDVVLLLSMYWIDHRIQKILSQSNLVDTEHPSVAALIKLASDFLDPNVLTESLPSIGLALHEIMDNVCGVVSIGPFGCLPSRVTESILQTAMNTETVEKVRKIKGNGQNVFRLPWLPVEVDGRSMSQVLEAKLNAFTLQAARLHEQMMSGN